MAVARIDTETCDRSPGCPVRRLCPAGAVRPIEGGPYPGAAGYLVDAEKCAGCGVCLRFCPTRAVGMVG